MKTQAIGRLCSGLNGKHPGLDARTLDGRFSDAFFSPNAPYGLSLFSRLDNRAAVHADTRNYAGG